MKNLLYLVLITLIFACNKEDETTPQTPTLCTVWQCNSSYYKETSGTPNSSSNTYYYVYKVKKVKGTREIVVDKLASDTAAIRAILSPFGITYDYKTTTLGSGNTQNSFEESILTGPDSFEEVVFEFRHSAPTALYKIVSKNFSCQGKAE